MSDAMSDAVRQKRDAESWIGQFGWVRHYTGWRGSLWEDPLDGLMYFLQDALRIQDARLEAVKEVTGS